MTETREMGGPDPMYEANALEALLPTENALQASRERYLHNFKSAVAEL